MIRVRALFFALYRDLTGSRELDVELPDGASVSDLVRSVRGRGAPFDRLPADPAIAVNRVYARTDVALKEGDEIAFIPPVAGG
jgi:molybdopterin converting factor subunit 1